MNTVSRAFLISILLLATGCITTVLTPEGAAVRITTNQEVVRNCKYIQYVEGRDHMNGGMMGQGAAEENAMRRLRNNAAILGANTVHIATKTTGWSGSAARGEAYYCER